MFLRENVSIWNLPRPEGSIVGRPSWLRLPHPLPPALECQRQPGQGQEEQKSEAREAAQALPSQQVSQPEVARTGAVLL